MLLKLHYSKFDVSRLFCSKGIDEKRLGGGGRLDPRGLDKRRVNISLFQYKTRHEGLLPVKGILESVTPNVNPPMARGEGWARKSTNISKQNDRGIVPCEFFSHSLRKSTFEK